MATSKRAQRGSALLTVLWMSAALAAIALALSTTVRSETDRVGTSADGLRALYLASGSVERGIQWMMWGGDYRNPDGSPRFWEANQPRLIMHYASGDATVEMIPESSKLNLNTATMDQLTRVLTVLTDDAARSAEIARAIVDWRSGAGGNPPSISEPLNVGGSGPTFSPRHASFEEIEELLLVRGVTPELFYGNFVADSAGRLYTRGGLRDAVTVWGSNFCFDVNTASPVLLESLGLPASVVAQIVAQRTIRPFRSLAEVGVSVPQGCIGGNTVWTLRATARLKNSTGGPSDVVRTSSAVVKLLDRRQYFQTPVHVLRYYEDAWSQLAVAPPGPGGPGGAQ